MFVNEIIMAIKQCTRERNINSRKIASLMASSAVKIQPRPTGTCEYESKGLNNAILFSYNTNKSVRLDAICHSVKIILYG